MAVNSDLLERWLLGLVSGMVAAFVFYVVASTLTKSIEAGVVTAFGVPFAALVWHGVVAIKNRQAPDDEK